MPFLAPLALLGLLFVPAVIAMYLLKLRRDEHVVPSTLLWHRLVADVEANAPWQRLRRSLLLLLQLLLVLLLAALAARPFLERPAGLARDLVVVIDTSASMAATDAAPSRLEAAKAQAIDALHDLPADGQVSVIAAGRTARVVVNGTNDLGRVRAAITGIQVSPASGNLGDALNLANALAARSGDAEVLVATDAALAVKPAAHLDHPVKVLQVGRERANQAIVALAVRPAPSGVTRSVFVSVANLDIEKASRRVELWGDGVLLEARDVFLEPQARTEVIVDDVPRAVGVVEVRLTSNAGATGTAAAPAATADALALDDRAWAIVPPDRLRRILLVSDGDPYLETALTYLPNTELYGVTPAKYGADTHPEVFDLIIFEGTLPQTLPRSAILAIAPTATSDLGEVTGTASDPGIGTPPAAEPILRYVDLTTVHVGTTQKLTVPPWARIVLSGTAGTGATAESIPLLYVGERAGQRLGVLAFEPRQSDLPLQVAFPILMANLTGELLGGSSAPTTAVIPGDPVSLPLPAGATGLTVMRPDGTSVDVPAATVDAATVSFSQTDQLGVYTATPIGLSASPGPSSSGAAASPSTSLGASASADASPGATAGPGASAGPGGSAGPSVSPATTPPPANPNEPIRFAVDLFDPAESDIAPGSPSAIAALGPQPGDSAAPASSGSPAPSGPSATAQPGVATITAEPRQPARDELWIPIVLIALIVLTIEWLVYHRDAVIRGWRSLRRRDATGQPNGRSEGRTT
jgi:von Willebrand factor type A domain/Aerotolerance regulator N-terminal